MTEEMNSQTIQQRTPVRDESTLRYRIDNEDVYLEIKQRLLGFVVGQKYNEETDEYEVTQIPIGSPKVNDAGYQAIMFQIQTLCNKGTVQGNLDDNIYESTVADFHLSLSNSLFKNMEKYGIDEDDYEEIVQACTQFVRVFLTRPLYNKERESYGEGFRETHTVNSAQKTGFLGTVRRVVGL